MRFAWKIIHSYSYDIRYEIWCLFKSRCTVKTRLIPPFFLLIPFPAENARHAPPISYFDMSILAKEPMIAMGLVLLANAFCPCRELIFQGINSMQITYICYNFFEFQCGRKLCVIWFDWMKRLSSISSRSVIFKMNQYNMPQQSPTET